VGCGLGLEQGVYTFSLGGYESSAMSGAGGSASCGVRVLRPCLYCVAGWGAPYDCQSTDGWSRIGPGGVGDSITSHEGGAWRDHRFIPLALDVNEDGTVNASDVAAVLAAWGDLKQDNFADTNLDGRVDAVDLVRVLSGWGGDGRE